MKKKFGELTIKEIYEECENHKKCGDCPLYHVCPMRYPRPMSYVEDLDTEVELCEQ